MRAFIHIVVIVVLLGDNTSFARTVPDSQQLNRLTHGQAVEQARAGNLVAARKALEHLYQQEPSNLKIKYDLLLVYHWSHLDRKAVDLGSNLELGRAPVYVLKSLASSHRNLKQYKKSLQVFKTCNRAFPDEKLCADLIPRVMAESGEMTEAKVIVEARIRINPSSTEDLFSLGYIYQRQQKYVDAITQYEKVLRIQPEHADARKQKLDCMISLGIALPARSLMSDQANRVQARKVADKILVNAIRWSELYPESEATRYDEAKRTLKEINQYIRKLEISGDQAAIARARIDRLRVFHNLGQKKRVLSEYQSMLTKGVEVPVHALVVVASAYESQQQPLKSIALYHRILQQWPKNFEARMGLFYAYLSAGKNRQAIELIDELAAEEPRWKKSPDRKNRIPNYKKLNADVAAAMARAYTDQLKAAQERLEPLVQNAPINYELRNKLATVYLWRGWPSKALEEYRIAKTNEPENMESSVGLVNTYLDLGFPEKAEPALDELMMVFAEEKQAQDVKMRFDKETGWKIYTEVMATQNDATTEESHEIDISIYGPRYANDLRGVGRIFRQSASFESGTIVRNDIGFGGLWEHDRRSLQAMLHEDRNRNDGSVATNIRAAVHDDRWGVELEYDSDSNQVPMEAYKQGIDGKSTRLSLSYSESDLSGSGINAMFMDMSDSNRRSIASAYHYFRIHTDAEKQVSTRTDVSTSSNSLNDTAYFNPDKDFQISQEASIRWTGYRRGRMAMMQTVTGGIGVYSQSGFNAEFTAFLRYENDWDLDRMRSIQYGIELGSNVFDGERENNINLFFSGDW